ncbi:dTDP-glucose 4,6-dehydratase [Paractinoplanes lichenicola]|uniref:GDP-mannose 4,6-dehydratase n=1 Tax=Paractinoplanes lichenicola TaxID=2802976 RepID=A0ABS1VX53_9ACTN|nr:NAD-dependent epimerase/dehydratase family protein [Actinoplanes lichenicola]MBL7259032.1 GDP-mannose 4,6-dehydratase [Actinoplanes lichenicola]
MNVLVTGGAGFVGSHFVRAVLADRLPGLEGARVTVLDKLTSAGNFNNLGEVAHDKRLDFVPGDVADAALTSALVRKHDAIVHLAADSDPASGVLGAQALLDAAHRYGVERFVTVSAGSVYGSVKSGSSTERAPLNPTTPFAAAKAGADLLTLAYHRTHGLPATIVRPTGTYGSHQHPDKIIPRMVTRLLAGDTAPLFGDGSDSRDWLHVYDLTRALALVLTDGRPGETYNVGGSIEITTRVLTTLLLDQLGLTWDRVETVADHPPHDARHALDDDKIRQDLGWRPRVEFDAGLNTTVRWYRDNPDWWQPL